MLITAATRCAFVCTHAYTQMSQKAGLFSVAWLKMDLPFHPRLVYSRVHRRSARLSHHRSVVERLSASLIVAQAAFRWYTAALDALQVQYCLPNPFCTASIVQYCLPNPFPLPALPYGAAFYLRFHCLLCCTALTSEFVFTCSVGQHCLLLAFPLPLFFSARTLVARPDIVRMLLSEQRAGD